MRVISRCGVAMPCVAGALAPCEPRVAPWLAVLIVARKLVVTGLRSVASSEGITLGAEELGKYKTIFQIFALTGLLMHERYVFIDFHLVVAGAMSVEDAHAICDRIEAKLREAVADAQITIHVEPEEKAKHTGIVVV